jgi:predicted transcriptional regulator
MNDPIKSAESIRKKFGLDYPTSQSETPSQPPFIENAAQRIVQNLAQAANATLASQLGSTFASFGADATKVLTELGGLPTKTSRVYDLVDRCVIDIDAVIKLIEQLSLLGFVQYNQKDTRGNHLVQLTESGQAMMGTLGQALSILKALAEVPTHQLSVYDIVDRTRLEFDSVIKLLEQLSKLELVRYLERNSRGNHLVQLTDRGTSLLS